METSRESGAVPGSQCQELLRPYAGRSVAVLSEVLAGTFGLGTRHPGCAGQRKAHIPGHNPGIAFPALPGAALGHGFSPSGYDPSGGGMDGRSSVAFMRAVLCPPSTHRINRFWNLTK